MAWTFVNDTGGNPGIGQPLSVAQHDGNTLMAKDGLAALQAAAGAGKLILTVTSSGTALTFTYTSGSPDIFPLPVPEIRAAGDWANSTPYARFDIVTVRGVGIFLVLEDHTTPASPAEFDPEATDGSSDENPLYVKIGEQQPVEFPVAFSIFGVLPEDSQSDSDGTLIGKFSVIHDISMEEDLPLACAHLDTPGSDTDGIHINIEKNGVTIGAIAFEPGENDGTFTFPDTIGFTNGDRVQLRLMVADGVAADLSVSLPAERTDF